MLDVNKIKPLGPWILVKTDPAPTQSSGGIYLPDGNLQERLGHVKATILRTGPGKLATGRAAQRRKYEPHDLKPGDRVVFRGFLKESNRPNGIMDPMHSLIHIDDVLGLLDESEEARVI